MRSFILPQGRPSLESFLKTLDPNKRYEVSIKEYKRERSLEHNAFHWTAVINPIADFIGDSPEETHRTLCGEYFGWVDNKLGRPKPRRTTTHNEEGKRDVLNWEQMSNFVHYCQTVAAELGVQLPSEVA